MRYLPTISLCMIVKNDEETLDACLNCASGIADEIIIADIGSTDRTKEIAKKHTDKIYDYKWKDDFSAARNFSFEQAAMDYILWLDADDVLLEDDRILLLRLKEELDESVDAVMMRHNIDFDTYGNPVCWRYGERLIKRSRGFKWTEPVNEYLKTEGNIIQSDIAITRKENKKAVKGRYIEIYAGLLSEGKQLSPRGNYYYARELKDCGKIDEAIERFNLFLQTKKGLTEDCINACCELAQCYVLKNMPELAFLSLLNTFTFDVPRAQACCMIGCLLMDKKEYRKAAFWFELASTLKAPEYNREFVNSDYSDFIPFMELAVCHDRLGEWERAEIFNNKAGECKPQSLEFLYNKKYFASLKQKNEMDKSQKSAL